RHSDGKPPKLTASKIGPRPGAIRRGRRTEAGAEFQMATLTRILNQGKPSTRPVDEVPPLRRLLPLGIQHVLAMYAGAVAVPLIVGGAMVGAGQLEQSDIVHLIMADLF